MIGYFSEKVAKRAEEFCRDVLEWAHFLEGKEEEGRGIKIEVGMVVKEEGEGEGDGWEWEWADVEEGARSVLWEGRGGLKEWEEGRLEVEMAKVGEEVKDKWPDLRVVVEGNRIILTRI